MIDQYLEIWWTFLTANKEAFINAFIIYTIVGVLWELLEFISAVFDLPKLRKGIARGKKTDIGKLLDSVFRFYRKLFKFINENIFKRLSRR